MLLKKRSCKRFSDGIRPVSTINESITPRRKEGFSFPYSLTRSWRKRPRRSLAYFQVPLAERLPCHRYLLANVATKLHRLPLLINVFDRVVTEVGDTWSYLPHVVGSRCWGKLWLYCNIILCTLSATLLVVNDDLLTGIQRVRSIGTCRWQVSVQHGRRHNMIFSFVGRNCLAAWVLCF